MSFPIPEAVRVGVKFSPSATRECKSGGLGRNPVPKSLWIA